MGENAIDQFNRPPQRVVSLVPSVTESLFDLGIGGAVVGITDYCMHPIDLLTAVPRVGGPKNPDPALIVSLEPDLVIANQEENSPKVIAALRAKDIPVWVTFPRSVRGALNLLYDLVRVFQASEAYLRLKTLEKSIEWAEADRQSRARRRYFCPIWTSHDPGQTRWWMTFNGSTYPHDLLDLLGGENIFADRVRRYPLAADLGQGSASPSEGRDTRYPRVTQDEIFAQDPEYILLPDEPYGFQEKDAQHLTPLVVEDGGRTPVQIRSVDGSLLFWHGTRLGLALQQLGDLFMG